MQLEQIIANLFNAQHMQTKRINGNDEYWFQNKLDVKNNAYRITMALYEEIGELIQSTNFHWWKDVGNELKQLDDLFSNFYMELVDLMHFIITLDIRDYMSYPVSTKDVSTVLTNSNIHDKLKQLPRIVYESILTNLNLYDVIKTGNKDDLYALINKFIMTISTRVYQTHEHKRYFPSYFAIFYEFVKALSIFTKYDFETLFKHLCNVYNGKHALNMLRLDNGYKKGEYKKVWKDGREDNYHLMEFLKQNKNAVLDYETIYNYLKSEYEKQF
jgi:hypothetical protein